MGLHWEPWCQGDHCTGGCFPYRAVEKAVYMVFIRISIVFMKTFIVFIRISKVFIKISMFYVQLHMLYKGLYSPNSACT